MKVTPTAIADVLIIKLKVFSGGRVFFYETIIQKAFNDANLTKLYPRIKGNQPVYRDFRAGDVPTQRIDKGRALAMSWYVLQEKK